MAMARFLQILLARKPAALLLGIGALFAGNSAADASAVQARGTGAADANQVSPANGTVLIRVEEGKIYISEHGKPFEQLPLSDTAEAEYLKQLLRELAPDGRTVAADSTRISVADGGAGWHWRTK